MASFFLNREGNLSAFKIGVGAAVLGGLVIAGGFVLSTIEQASYKAPLDLALPPNTVIIVQEELSAASRRVYLESSETPESLARFYDEQLAEAQGIDVADANRERCIRTPRDGTYNNYVEGNGVIPYEYKCLFQENSLQGIDRYTQVSIQPGVRNDETGMDNLNTTRIEYEQFWQP